MNLRRLISGFVAATLFVSTASTSSTQAQSRRPTGVASLGEMPCQVMGGQFRRENTDITVGREIFRGIAYINSISPSGVQLGVPPDRTIRLVCRLAALNEAPRFRTLTLALALSEASKFFENNSSASVRISIYRDSNFYGSQTVSRGDKIRWPVDVKNTRSIALEVECVTTRDRNSSCPALWFLEDILER